MNENQQWAHEELTKLMKNSPTYEDQAFYRALDQLMLKQAQRLVNAAGELDGRSWAKATIAIKISKIIDLKI